MPRQQPAAQRLFRGYLLYIFCTLCLVNAGKIIVIRFPIPIPNCNMCQLIVLCSVFSTNYFVSRRVHVHMYIIYIYVPKLVEERAAERSVSPISTIYVREHIFMYI